MNNVTRMAIRDVFKSDPAKAISVKTSPVMCLHPNIILDYSPPWEPVKPLEFKLVDLEPYRYNEFVTLVGRCPKCHKVYYKD